MSEITPEKVTMPWVLALSALTAMTRAVHELAAIDVGAAAVSLRRIDRYHATAVGEIDAGAVERVAQCAELDVVSATRENRAVHVQDDAVVVEGAVAGAEVIGAVWADAEAGGRVAAGVGGTEIDDLAASHIGG